MNLITYFRTVIKHAQHVQQIENVDETELRRELARVNEALRFGEVKGLWSEAEAKDQG